MWTHKQMLMRRNPIRMRGPLYLQRAAAAELLLPLAVKLLLLLLLLPWLLLRLMSLRNEWKESCVFQPLLLAADHFLGERCSIVAVSEPASTQDSRAERCKDMST
jgi:hypothetical protein